MFSRIWGDLQGFQQGSWWPVTVMRVNSPAEMDAENDGGASLKKTALDDNTRTITDPSRLSISRLSAGPPRPPGPFR